MISGSWHPRAFLAAQIGESVKREVISTPDVHGALKLVDLTGVVPLAMVVDTAGGVRPHDVTRLLEAKLRTALVLVVSRWQDQARDAISDRCAAYLLRPVRIGGIADAVGRVLEEGNDWVTAVGSSPYR